MFSLKTEFVKTEFIRYIVAVHKVNTSKLHCWHVSFIALTFLYVILGHRLKQRHIWYLLHSQVR
jgi:hypothetical protein